MKIEKSLSEALASILIVDDDASDARNTEAQLRKAGFHVTGFADTADDAFRQICAKRPEIVLMDICIRGKIDGIQAAEIIRDRFAVPVIYVTSYTDDITLERAQETHPYGYLVKPISYVSLKATALTALQAHRSQIRIRKQAESLASCLNSMQGAMILTDLKGEVLVLNQRAADLWHVRKKRFVGELIFDLIQLKDSSSQVITQFQFETALNGEDKVDMTRLECTLFANGESFHKLNGQLSVLSRNGQAVGALISLHTDSCHPSLVNSLAERFCRATGEVGKQIFELFDHIDMCAANAYKSASIEQELDKCLEASTAGKAMSIELMNLWGEIGQELNENQLKIGLFSSSGVLGVLSQTSS